jgi:hypothetical protein
MDATSLQVSGVSDGSVTERQVEDGLVVVLIAGLDIVAIPRGEFMLDSEQNLRERFKGREIQIALLRADGIGVGVDERSAKLSGREEAGGCGNSGMDKDWLYAGERG